MIPVVCRPAMTESSLVVHRNIQWFKNRPCIPSLDVLQWCDSQSWHWFSKLPPQCQNFDGGMLGGFVIAETARRCNSVPGT